jgi:hypothetical protein
VTSNGSIKPELSDDSGEELYDKIKYEGGDDNENWDADPDLFERYRDDFPDFEQRNACIVRACVEIALICRKYFLATGVRSRHPMQAPGLDNRR